MKYTKDKFLLKSSRSDKVKFLHKLYKKDKYVARVIYQNTPTGHEDFDLYKFTEENGDLSIVLFRCKTGISKTNKMYTADKRMFTISYKKKGNKFWFINNQYDTRYVNKLTMNSIFRYIPHEYKEEVLDALQERFSWVRFLREKDVIPNVSFAKIVSDKMYSFKKAVKFTYGVPYPVAKILHTNRNGTKYMNIVHHFKHYREFMDNVESFNVEWISDGNGCSMLHDTLKMAKTLGKKVNCSWSIKRLKSEHDKWATEITDIVFIDGNRDMLVNEMYLDFAKFSGYKILTTTKEMAIEGRRQKHCVATYVGQVDSGHSGIYVVDNYTLELGISSTKNIRHLKRRQFRGYDNKQVPKEMLLLIDSVIDDFNLSIGFDTDNPQTPDKVGVIEVWNGDDLPF